jgi:hypothetical protein
MMGAQSSTNQRAGQIVNKLHRKMHFTLLFSASTAEKQQITRHLTPDFVRQKPEKDSEFR